MKRWLAISGAGVGVLLVGVIGFAIWWASPPLGAIVVDESRERHAYGREIRVLLSAGRYDDLESIADSLCRKDVPFASGASRLSAFYEDGFGEVDAPRQAAAWSEHLRRLRHWVDNRPPSSVARMALAEALIGRGWTARGNGMGWTVTRTRGQQFERDMAEAARVLLNSPPDARACPVWHEATLAALHSFGSSTDPMYRACYAEAVKRFPADLRLYTSMSNHLLPIWYGQRGEWDRYAANCTEGLPDSLADEVYARVVLARDRLLGNTAEDCPSLSWRKVRHGLEAWQRHCPQSLQPASAMALLAVDFKQRFAARRAFDRLGGQLEMEIWRNAGTYRFAHLWAFLDR